MKTCTSCLKAKELEAFAKRLDGHAASCKECINTRCRAAYHAQPGVKTAAVARARKVLRARKARDPAYRNAWSAWNYAREIKRVPPWVKFTRDILPIYERLHSRFGAGYCIDHIIPLKGKNVCGLHVPENLRITLCRANQLKAARFDEADLPYYDALASYTSSM